MKLVTFQDPQPKFEPSESGDFKVTASTLRPGILENGQIYDLQAGYAQIAGEEPESLLRLLESPQMLAQLDEVRDLLVSNAPSDHVWDAEQIVLAAPLPRPRTLRDCLAYEQHLVQCTRTVLRQKSRWLASLDAGWERWLGRPLVKVPAAWYEHPVYYKGNPDTVVGTDCEIRWPSITERLDFELELAVVVGREGRDIEPAEAAQHLVGYTIFNDFSARDIQLREMQARLGPAKGKDFDTGNVLGPVIVTIDELGMAPKLNTRVAVNGETWSESSTADLHFSIEEIISWISRDETLHPGDVIGLGTVPFGCGLELDRWIQPGDVVEVSIDRIGTLRNRIGPKPGKEEG